jgi:lipopolysaccharide biosynthesis protein
MTVSRISKGLPKVIAFHLPQFHRIPENDAWWGEGFTEWTNVRKSTPRYRGHQQPSVPLANRYYDLTDPSTREWQAELARRYGVEGFCYYHYWFKGKLLLEQPCEAILASGKPDFPFCFSWANESWTRSWDGANRSVLIRQDYGTERDWTSHFRYLLPFFKDRRYITHDGLPLFLIYRPADFPAVDQMMALWNRLAREEGIPGVFFVKTLTSFDARPASPPFLASVSFEPGLTYRRYSRFTVRVRNLARYALFRAAQLSGLDWTFVISYDEIWQDILRRCNGRNEFPGAFVGWDNTPRMGARSSVIAGSNPRAFGGYMRQLLSNAVRDGSPFVFLNAWNEWAEGAYLEPDERHGHAYLEQLAAAIATCKSDLERGELIRAEPMDSSS